MNVDITANGKKAVAELKLVGKEMQNLAGGQAAGLQKGFKSAASELSNIAGVYTGNRLSGVTSQVTSLAGAVGAIPGPAGLAAGAIAGIGTAAISAAKGLFEMAHEAAVTTKAVGGFSYITGFSVEATSALSYALALTGKELSDIQRPMVFFGKQLAAAADGSKEAQENLAKLGITKFDNLERAFAQATKKIDGTSNEVERLGLTVTAFGARGGPEIEKVMHKMGGDFTKFIDKARELGITLSEDDVRAAKEFSTTYEKVMFQATIAANKFALAYGSEITQAMEDVSKYLAENKDKWSEWGKEVKPMIGGVIALVKDLASFFSNEYVAAIGKATPPTLRWLGWLKEAIELYGKVRGNQQAEQYGPFAEDMGKTPHGDGDVTDATTGGMTSSSGKPFLQPGDIAKSGLDSFNQKVADEIKKFDDDQKKRAKEREDYSKRDQAAQLANLKAQLQDAERAYTDLHDRLMEKFGEDKDGSALTSALTPAWQKLRDEAVGLIKQMRTVQDALDANATPQEKSGHTRDINDLQAGVVETGRKSQADVAKATAKDVKETAKDRADYLIAVNRSMYQSIIANEDYYLAIGLEKESVYAKKVGELKIAQLQFEKDHTTDKQKIFELDAAIAQARVEMATKVYDAIVKETKAENDKTDALKKQREEYDKLGQAALEDAGAIWGQGERDKRKNPLSQQIDDLMDRMGAVKDIKSSLREMGSIGVSAFEDMTAAVGDAIAQWALYGGSIGEALKKALAAELAHIAAVSTVNALYATALGFIRLAEHDFVAAGHAFMSAGLWAALAAGTALGARALSGNAHGQGSSAQGGGGSNTNYDRSQDPYSRTSGAAYDSGRRSNQVVADAINKLNDRLDSMKPGDVLTRGMEQKPHAAMESVTQSARGGRGRKLAEGMGLR